MRRNTRITLFIVLALGLVAVFYAVGGTAVFGDVPVIVVLSALVTATLIALFVEHFFGTPSSVLATSVSAVLLLAPAHSELQELGSVYWVLVMWCIVLAAVSSAALLVLPSRDAKGSKAEKARMQSQRLKRFSVTYGSARFVFGLIAVTTALVYLQDAPLLAAVVVLYVVILAGMDTRRPTGADSSDGGGSVGKIVEVEPNGVLRVRLPSFSVALPGRHVSYMLPGDSELERRGGLVVGSYPTLEGPEALVLATEWSGVAADVELLPGDVLVQEVEVQQVDIGLVDDGSRISSIKVKTLALKDLQEGSLLSVRVQSGSASEEVIYQVFDATVRSDDSRGTTVAEAVQLGTWSEEDCGFMRYGWVPPVNAVVGRVEGECSTGLPEDSILLGSLPGTQYPVSMDKETLRGTHVAILGVTGCGKSVTSRYLLTQLAADDSRVVVIDLTGEYKRLLTDPVPNPIVTDDIRDSLIESIEKLMRQMAEFANKRDHNVIADCEKNLDLGFRKSLEGWIKADDGTYALLELPSFENTATSLEYTRWFLRTLFDIARSGGLHGKSVTVVLEEAHTVVPEWNFAGARGDKAAEGLLNSIAQIALQGRKHGIGFIVVAQRTANVSKTVLTQCSSVIAFRSYDNTSAEFLSNYLGDELVKALPNLPDRHAIVVGSAFHSQVPLICRVLDIEEVESETVETIVAEPAIHNGSNDVQAERKVIDADEEIPF